MSDTPRTDAFSKVPSDPQETWAIARDWAGFARTLERELAEAETRISELVIEKSAAVDARVVGIPEQPLRKLYEVVARITEGEPRIVAGMAAVQMGLWHELNAAFDDCIESVDNALNVKSPQCNCAVLPNCAHARSCPMFGSQGELSDVAPKMRSPEWWLAKARAEGDQPVSAGTDLWPGTFIAAVRNLTFMARTSGGTAGRDDGLCAALDAVEALLPPLDSAPEEHHP